MSIVLDTSDSDTSCDEPGTGTRMVASLEGGAAPPHVLMSTLGMSTAAFRKGLWLPLQLELRSGLSRVEGDSWAPRSSANGTEWFTVSGVWLNGTVLLYPPAVLDSYAPLMRAADMTVRSRN